MIYSENSSEKLETKFVFNRINDSNPGIITDMTFIEAKLYKNILSESEIRRVK